MFGPKIDDVTGELRKLHNEQLHQIIRMVKIEEDEIGGACKTRGGGEVEKFTHNFIRESQR
jgi:hypothetical protein